MDYCNASDIIDACGIEALSDMLQTAPAELPDHAALAKAAADASLRIDSYLVSRYALPLPVVAESLRVVAVDVAVYYLFRLRRPGDLKDYLERYQVQVDWLERVRTGALDVPEMSAIADANADAVRVIAPPSAIGWSNY